CSSSPCFTFLTLAALALLPLAGLLLLRRLELLLFRTASGMRLERFALAAKLLAAARCAVLRGRQQLAAQRAGARSSFYQTDVADVTELGHGTAACAHESVAALVIVEIFRAKGSDRDQSVRTRLAQLDEQAGARDAGDAALKARADAIGQMMGD